MILPAEKPAVVSSLARYKNWCLDELPNPVLYGWLVPSVVVCVPKVWVILWPEVAFSVTLPPTHTIAEVAGFITMISGNGLTVILIESFLTQPAYVPEPKLSVAVTTMYPVLAGVADTAAPEAGVVAGDQV